METPKKLSLNGIDWFKMIWKSGLKIGYSSQASEFDKKSVMLLNGVVMSMCISSLVFFLALILLGFDRHHYLYIIPVSAGVMFYHHHRKFNAARVLYLIGTFVVVGDWCYEGRGDGNEYAFILLATTSTLILTDKFLIYLVNFVCAGIFIVCKMYDFYHPLTVQVPTGYHLLPGFIFLNSVAIVSFQVAFFRDIAQHYKNKLEVKYKEISQALELQKSTDEALKESNEELQILNDQLHAATEQLKLVLKQKNSELETYVEAINVSIYSSINDRNGNFLMVNEPLIRSSGFCKEELIGKSYHVLSSGYHPEAFHAEKYEAVISGKTWRGEVKYKRKDGSFFWSDCVVIPIRDEDGQVSRFLSLGLPITERKQTEEMKEKALVMLETIAFETSHKVRGPLARIKGLSDLVQRDLIKEKEFKFIAEKFGVCSDELSSATSGLVKFVINHQEYFA